MSSKVAETTGKQDVLDAARANDAVSWRGPLSIDQYIQRDRYLDEIVDSAGLEERDWAVLGEGNAVLASARCLVRPAYLKEPNKPGREVRDAVIANVFTPERQRGKGYATTLIKQITDELKDTYEVVSLWSDVGDWYAKFGFRFAEPTSHTLTVRAAGDLKWPKGLARLSEADALAAVPEHARAVRAAVDKAVESTNTPIVAVLPHEGLYRYMFSRGRFIRGAQGLETTQYYGARSETAWAVWSYKGGSDVEVMLVEGAIADLVPLFQAAAATAAPFGFGVSFYEGGLIGGDSSTGEKLLTALKDAGLEASRERREGSLPMYASKADWILPGLYSWQ